MFIGIASGEGGDFYPLLAKGGKRAAIVMKVTATGDKVGYRLGKSKRRSRTPISCGGAHVATAVIETL